MDIKILIATHKPYKMPADSIYLPVQVGKALQQTEAFFTADDTGDNISEKNPNYCELTALYWAWKNLTADFIGLAHYRRHFFANRSGRSKDKFLDVLTREQAQRLCENYSVILPNKRKYYIETNYSHYIHSHLHTGLDLAGEIIKSDYPEYAAALDKVLHKRSWAHMFNMFIMRKDRFDPYCAWLFDILFKVEKKLDISAYNAVEARVFGYISELLLDVWILKNNIDYIEIPVKFMEKQNWAVKGGLFLRRKFFPNKN
jgi:hypothetical protein